MIELIASLPKPIAYVFGGGGSYGAVQVGQLRAIAKTDLLPDFVVGTSVGSLNATIVAETPLTAGDRLGGFWSLASRRDIFGSTRQMMRNMVTLRPGIADSRPLRDLLERSTASRDFTDLSLPLTAVAADAVTGHVAELRDGDLISALMASTAIPGVFPIVERDGQRLMDGGIIANVPIAIAAEQGAKSIVVFDCGFNLFAPTTDPTLPHVLLRAAAIMAAAQVRRDLALCASECTILYVPGKWPPISRPYEFNKTDLNNQDSYQVALKWLRELQIKGTGLHGAPPDVTRVER